MGITGGGGGGGGGNFTTGRLAHFPLTKLADAIDSLEAPKYCIND